MLASANTDPTPSKQKLPANERRAAIIASAIDLFAQKGFRGTTTREIAAAAGVSEPVIYQHFTTKSELYTAIVDHMIADLASRASEFEKLREAADTRQFFNWLGMQILDWFSEGGRRSRLLFYSALEGHELAKIWHEKATSLVGSYLEPLIQSHEDRGLFRKLPARVATKAFIGMVSDYGLGRTIFGCPDYGVAPETMVAHFVDIFLHGIEKPSGVQQPAV
jgi:AcrR family transcriptional regulator